jgi:phage gpG-like protein
MIAVELEFDAVHEALFRKADQLRLALEARVKAKLAGEVLRTRSGALANSISSTIETSDNALILSVSSVGIPYAAIQEYGGRTAAHEIVAVKAKALAFTIGGANVFAKRVHHPGSTIPARSYLGSAVSEMRDEIETGLKGALREALGR